MVVVAVKVVVVVAMMVVVAVVTIVMIVCCPHIRVAFISLVTNVFTLLMLLMMMRDGKEKCVVVQIRDELFPRHTHKTSKLN